MLKLRLTRLGDKKRPSYRLVAMEALSKRDGGAIAYLGNYFPLEDFRSDFALHSKKRILY